MALAYSSLAEVFFNFNLQTGKDKEQSRLDMK
jgi:hypothetical protein